MFDPPHNPNLKVRPMSLMLSTAIMDIVIARLLVLFLTCGNDDVEEARQIVRKMLADHNPQTEEELCLAGEIIGFGFQALEALSRAADPARPLKEVLQLQGRAISMSRESHRNQHKLDQLQRARHVRAEEEPVAAEDQAPSPQDKPSALTQDMEQAASLIQAARDVVEAAGRKGGVTWSQSYQKRQTAKRIADNMKKKQAEHTARAA
jgi:hypothetical protein